MNKPILIKNGKVLLFENEEVTIREKDIRINDGKIEEIGENLNKKENEYLIDAKDKIVMPGLINTHTHIAMCIFRGTFEGCNLYTWLNEKIWPIEARLKPEQIYNASMYSIIEMISTGTTCANDQYFMAEETRKAAEELNMRVAISRVLLDTDGKDFDEKIQEFRDLYETRNKENDLITYTIDPHGFYTCTPSALEKIRELALEYKLPIHVHFMESIDEVESIKKLHGMKGSQVLKKYFGDMHTILAHGVKLDDEDIEILKTLDCGIAHNPVSNLRLGCKIADTTKYLKNGINVALGTDGQGSGNNLDMFEAMRTACLIQGGIHENEERITSRDAIKMATINGAKLLGLDDKIGSIEEGKDADIILVDISKKLDNITKLPNNDLISNLVYNTSGRDVDTTIIKGKILMENREIKNVDLNKIISNVENIF